MPRLNTHNLCVISLRFWSRAALAIAANCLLAGCITGAPPVSAVELSVQAISPAQQTEEPVSIGVLDLGWHTGVILPANKLASPLVELRRWFPHTKYLQFGWGNRRFYMTARPDIGMAIASLFPSPSTILVQTYRLHPGTSDEVHWLCVSAAGFRKLQAYVADSFRKDGHGDLIGLQAEVSPHSEFFASPDSYDAFHTCNTWTATALRTAGLPVANRGVIFARQVMSEIRPLSTCTRAAS